MSAVIDPSLTQIAELTAKVAELDTQIHDIKTRVPENRVSIILLSGDFDKAVKLADMAKRQSTNALAQAEAQKNAGPNY